MARSDPRAEPTSTPPTVDHSVERVIVSKNPSEKDKTPSEGKLETAAPLPEQPPPSSITSTVTSDDPRLLEIEPMLEVNDWKAAAAKLGPLEDAGKLPPNLGLIAAIAHNESTPDGSPEARALAVRCTAGLLGMPLESEVARILARRILRKAAPTRLREQPAPPAKQSAIIVVVVLAVGGALGWFLSTPYWTRILQMIVH